MASNYFNNQCADQKLLGSHGLTAWPTLDELTCYTFELEDELDAICQALGLEVSRDIRGRWQVYSLRGERKCDGYPTQKF